MKVLIIDNYDSFTFNLYQYLGEILQEGNRPFQLEVIRNDQLTLTQIKRTNFDKIVISPGPGDPANLHYFGVCGEVITVLGQTIPVLGVCLGMQGMAHFFGGKVVRAKLPMHGKVSTIVHDEQGVFTNLPQMLSVMRYHSLVADPSSLPACLKITALTTVQGADFQRALVLSKEAEIMGLRHVNFPVEGIQFHPESFATEGGKQLLKNFLTRQERLK